MARHDEGVVNLGGILKLAQRWASYAGVITLSLIAVAGFALSLYAAWLFHDLPDASRLADYRPALATRVFAWDGTLIGEFSKERRIFVPYDETPKRVIYAFLAAEDHNFFEHGGIDLSGMGRAFAKNIVNLAEGHRFEGGSTITQQVAKNILLNNQQSLGRKLKEAILARRLEATLDKSQILELYLNEIFLGYRSYGVGAAAFNYFGKSLDQLTLAEAAYLACLPKGPNNYQPIKRKDAAIRRRNWILDEMARQHWVTLQEAEAAKAEDLVVQTAPERAKYKDADFFVEEVRRRAVAQFGPKLFEGGYYLRTTLEPELQTAARVALMNGLEAYDRRHGWRGPWGRVAFERGWEQQALKMTPPSERRDWRSAVVKSASAGGVQILTVDGETGVLGEADIAWARAGRGGALKSGDLIFVAKQANGRFALKQIPAVNGALVAMDPESGRVLAMVGGYSFSLSEFNRATQASRQPGSAFKPFVYATALQNGFTPASEVLDAPISFTNPDGSVWSPENYTKEYFGMQTLRRGLEMSRNVMTVRLAEQVGMRKIAENAIKFGVVDKMEPVLSMALGAGETTPFRITAAYSAFANGGRKVDPHLIELVQDRDGKIINRADGRDCANGCKSSFDADAPLIPQAGETVLDDITAYQITSYLEGVVQHGTGYAAHILGPNVAGKTGTTNEYRSAWFVGFTPNIVVGVFIGFDDNHSLGTGEAGAAAAVPVFIDFMQTAQKVRPHGAFIIPKTAKFILVHGVPEAFRPGTEPKVVDPLDALKSLDVAPAAGVVPPPGPPIQKPAIKKPPEDVKGLF